MCFEKNLMSLILSICILNFKYNDDTKNNPMKFYTILLDRYIYFRKPTACVYIIIRNVSLFLEKQKWGLKIEFNVHLYERTLGSFKRNPLSSNN